MKKRTRKLALLLIVLGLILTACGGGGDNKSGTGGEQSSGDNAGSQQPIELKISTQVSASHSWVPNVLEPLAEDIERVTEGRVTATVYAGGALGDPSAQYDSAVTGVADIAVGLHGYHPGDFPLTEVIELPFMASNSIQGTKTLWALYENIPEIAAEYEDVKVIGLFTGDPNILITSDKKIESAADLKNLKMRSPAPVANRIFETFGAAPVSIPAPDLYESMMRGVVDGALTSASAVPNFALADVTKYATRDPIYTTSFYIVMNKNTWNKISPEDQEALSEIFGEALSLRFAENYVNDEAAGWALMEESGVEIIDLPDSEIEAWKEQLKVVSDQWIEEMEAAGFPGQKIYDEAVRISAEHQ